MQWKSASGRAVIQKALGAKNPCIGPNYQAASKKYTVSRGIRRGVIDGIAPPLPKFWQ
jgi:hypothetical protein